MTGRYVDFDAARAERVAEPLTLRAYGRDFELPSVMPAAVFLDVMRIQAEREGEQEITAKEAVGLLQRVLPAAVLEELLGLDAFSLDDLTELVRMVMDAYTGGSGEAPAPSRAARRHPPSARPRGSRAGSSAKKKAPGKAAPGPKSSSIGER